MHKERKQTSEKQKHNTNVNKKNERTNEPTNQHITHNLAYTKQQNANDVYLT